MEMKFRWKTILAIVAMVLMANFILVETAAWARAGGGRSSSGSRGSRSYSAPVGPSSPGPSSRPSPGVTTGDKSLTFRWIYAESICSRSGGRSCRRADW